MKAIEHTATQFLKFVAYKSEYMAYKASHQAAVVCILTLKLFCCPAALDLGLARVVPLVSRKKTRARARKLDAPMSRGNKEQGRSSLDA